MFVNRRLDNSDPLAKISPEILQKIDTVQTTIGVATHNNTPDTIVKRDAVGDFSAGTAKLDALESNSAVLNIAAQNATGTVNIGSGTGVQSVNIGNNGTGTTTIRLGGSGDTVSVGTSSAPAGSVSIFPTGMSVNGTVTGGNVANPCDFTMDMTAVGAVNSNFSCPSGRFLISARAHNSAQGTKSVPAGFQTQVLQNNASPLKSVLVFLGSATVTGSTISECGSIDSDGTFKCSSVESRGTTLSIAGQDSTSILNLGSGTGVQTINMGNNGAGTTTINIGGGTDIVNFAGAQNIITGSLLVTGTGTNGTFRARSATVDAWIAPTSQGIGLGWNRNSGGGRGIFTNHQGLGNIGGWEWMNYNTDNSQTSANPQMVLDRLGNLSATGTVSAATPTAGTHLTTKTYVDGALATLANQNLKTTDIATFAGLILPTTGGTASTLNFYEEYVHNTVFGSATFTGTLGVLFARIGKVVTMTFPYYLGFTAESTTRLFNSVLVPVRFRPGNRLFSHLEMVDNGVRVDGLVELEDGFITISPAHSTNFITGRVYTVYGFSVSWVLQ